MPCLLILENAPSAEVRHASLREGLRRMLGVPVEVIYDTLGKPSLVGDTPLRYLSVTTTGSYMVAALAETPLGIDGERRDRFTPTARRACSRRRTASSRPQTRRSSAPTPAASARYGCGERRMRNTPDAAYAPSPSSRSATGTPCLRRSTACGLNRWPCRCPTRTRIFSPSRADGSPERGNGVISQQRLSSAVVGCRRRKIRIRRRLVGNAPAVVFFAHIVSARSNPMFVCGGSAGRTTARCRRRQSRKAARICFAV